MLIPFAAALAQTAAETPVPEADLELFRTSVGGRSTVWTDDAALPAPGPALRAMSFVGGRSLVYGWSDGTEFAVLGTVLRTDLGASFALGRFQAGLLAPVVWVATSDVAPGAGTGLGDVALDLRGVLVDGDESPAGLALAGRLGVPTATVDRPLGATALTGELSVIGTVDLGPGTLAVNLGQRFAPEARLDGNEKLNDAFAWRVAASAPFGDRFDVGLEGQGRLEYAVPASEGGAPAEALVTGGARLGGSGAALRLAAAKGLTDGLGVPVFRVVAGVSWAPSGTGGDVAKDADGDGLVDRDDRCVKEAEDPDGFEDADGCPDLDDDGDGLVDSVDQCRTEAEDLDGYKDTDGCPDGKSRLGVRVVSPDGEVLQPVAVVVNCPSLKRTISADQAVEVEPGTCSISGGGGDGIPPFAETVELTEPVEREFVVTPVTALGRVELVVEDPFGHPVEQAAWSFDKQPPMRVPGEAVALATLGTHSVKIYAKGRESRELDVVATSGRTVQLKVTLALEAATFARNQNSVTLGQPIGFVAGTAELDDKAATVLEAVAEVLASHHELLKLRIEAHVAEDGDGAKALTEARATAVRDALVARGIAAERLSVVGMGAGRPLPGGSSERIELWVEERR